MLLGPLREVECYVWDWEEDGNPCFTTVPAWDYWIGLTPKLNGNGTHIIVAEQYRDCREPDRERLVCGHIRPLPVWGGTKYYNRRRRCKECALEAIVEDTA